MHIKLCHKLAGIKNLLVPDKYYSPKSWLTQIPDENFKLRLTWEERDDGGISVRALLKVHHHLGRALPCVAPHGGPELKVTTPVDHGDDLPVILITSVHAFFELHLGHCRSK